MTIRLILSYKVECWLLKDLCSEVKMLKLMYEHTRSDKIRNENIRVKVGVTFIVNWNDLRMWRGDA